MPLPLIQYVAFRRQRSARARIKLYVATLESNLNPENIGSVRALLNNFMISSDNILKWPDACRISKCLAVTAFIDHSLATARISSMPAGPRHGPGATGTAAIRDMFRARAVELASKAAAIMLS